MRRSFACLNTALPLIPLQGHFQVHMFNLRCCSSRLRDHESQTMSSLWCFTCVAGLCLGVVLPVESRLSSRFAAVNVVHLLTKGPEKRSVLSSNRLHTEIDNRSSSDGLHGNIHPSIFPHLLHFNYRFGQNKSDSSPISTLNGVKGISRNSCKMSFHLWDFTRIMFAFVCLFVFVWWQDFFQNYYYSLQLIVKKKNIPSPSNHNAPFSL